MFPFSGNQWNKATQLKSLVLIHNFIYIHNLHTLFEIHNKNVLDTSTGWSKWNKVDSFWHDVTGSSRKCRLLRREEFEKVFKWLEQRHKVMPEFNTCMVYNLYNQSYCTLWDLKLWQWISLSFPPFFSNFRKLQDSNKLLSSEYLNGLCLTRRWNSYGNLLSMHISICNGSISYCRYYK